MDKKTLGGSRFQREAVEHSECKKPASIPPSRSLPIISRSPFGGAQAISHLAAPARHFAEWRCLAFRPTARDRHRVKSPPNQANSPDRADHDGVSEIEEERERLQHSLLEGEGQGDYARDRVNINEEAKALQPYKRNLTDRRTF